MDISTLILARTAQEAKEADAILAGMQKSLTMQLEVAGEQRAYLQKIFKLEAQAAPAAAAAPVAADPKVAGEKRKREKKEKKERVGPKRPASAFLLFCEAERARNSEKLSLETLGQAWKDVDADSKRTFSDQAKKLHDKWLAERKAFNEEHGIAEKPSKKKAKTGGEGPSSPAPAAKAKAAPASAASSSGSDTEDVDSSPAVVKAAPAPAPAAAEKDKKKKEKKEKVDEGKKKEKKEKKKKEKTSSQ